jgi:hypothetical protein
LEVFGGHGGMLWVAFLSSRERLRSGIEPDPFHLTGMPSVTYSFGKYEDRWAGRDHISEYEYRWNILSATFVQNS